MANVKKEPMKGGLKALIMCIGIIGLGVLIFAVLSAFGALRFWQAEKTPQGQTDPVSYTHLTLPTKA